MSLERATILDEMQGEKCFIYNQEGLTLLGQGTFSYVRPTVPSMMQGLPVPIHSFKDETYLMKIKQITNELTDALYIVKVLCKYDDKFFALELKDIRWINKAGNLETQISTERILLTEIDEEDYSKISNDRYEFNWSELIVPDDCSGAKQSDAFEDLINTLILHAQTENFSRIGVGVDRARDGQFEINMTSWLPKTNVSTKWILQCKYSVNKNTSLTIEEIYTEMIKVLMHQPDYYLVVTNRKITSDFLDWFNSDLMQGTNYFIPFKKVLIQREEIEAMLSTPGNLPLKKKYFG
ncbi:hypothetical protein [Paenibacillus sp. 2003]|uniref:hypothetical protein n=1 Tax=Paenibacillus sp. 2003 TaxID=2817761 RepID=UPI002859D8D8|nr:hypothetical protein [Paenibacillus sp. 2003]MDR6717404.1 hypothetical protein [Paenibacillus sp. 2003]